MGKKASKKSQKRLPGLDMDRFQAAVSAIAGLRDSGKLLVFIGRRSSVRMIVDTSTFSTAYAESLNERDIADDEPSKALDEVTMYLRLVESFNEPEQAAKFLEHQNYESEFTQLDDNAKEELRRLLEGKAKMVSKELLTEAMRDRSRRIATATAPCLEDLDAEVIQERRDEYQGRTLKEPFLRLRLRYSQGDPPFPFNLISSFPGSRLAPAFGPESFELECDLSDLDLLLLRLTAAKRRLTASQQNGDGD